MRDQDLSTNQTVESFIRRCKTDAEYFGEKCFDYVQAWQKQVEFHMALWDPKVREINCKGGHSTGKTHQISKSILEYFFVFQPILLILTPTLRQAKHQVWANIRGWYQKSKIPLGGELLETQLKVAPDWYALAFSTRDPNFLRGFKGKNVLLVIDEAQGIEEELWTAIEGLLAGGTCKIIRNGNPIVTDGAYKRAFDHTGPSIANITWSCLETPNYLEKKQVIPGIATYEWVEERRNEWGEGSIFWDALVLGEFPQVGDDNLVNMNWVKQAISNEQPLIGTRAVGVDPARYGHAETAMYAVDGCKVLEGRFFHGQDTMKTVGHARLLKADSGAKRIAVDVIGIGAGIVDRLAEAGEDVVGINVGMKSNDPERFQCLRDEVLWNLREHFRNGNMGLPELVAKDMVLINQICSIKFKIQSSKKIKVESKEEMKKRGLPSPDRLDALALAIYLSTVEHLVMEHKTDQEMEDGLGDNFLDNIDVLSDGGFNALMAA